MSRTFLAYPNKIHNYERREKKMSGDWEWVTSKPAFTCKMAVNTVCNIVYLATFMLYSDFPV